MGAVVLTSMGARRPVRPTWLQTVGAVIGGSIFACALTLAWLLPVAALELFPGQVGGETSGHGWPWRIEGPWSLAADFGPLMLCGAALAVGVEAFTVKWTGVRPRRLPLALVVAAVGWVMVGNVSNGGVLSVGGLVAFVAVVSVARECSVRERRPFKWTRGGIAVIALAVLVFAATSVSYGMLHPLLANDGNSTVALKNGRAEMSVFLRNEGPLDVHVLSVDIPGVNVIRVRTDNEAVKEAPTIDGLMKPIAGSQIASDASRVAYLTIASPGCIGATIDRFNVRLSISGRRLEQLVRLESPVRLTCS
jgi:hypothetical protein